MDETLKPAGFWIRLLAYFIDALVLFIPAVILIWLMGLHTHTTFKTVFCSLMGITYVVVFMSSRWQATPGKRLLKIYVIDARTGGRLSTSKALMRYIVLYCFHLFFVVSVTIMGGNFILNPLPPAAQKEYSLLKHKTHAETLSAEEHQRFLFLSSMEFVSPEDLSQAEKNDYDLIGLKMEKHEQLTPEESAKLSHITMHHLLSVKRIIMFSMVLLEMLYLFAVSLAIGVTPAKTGLHDMICKTRVIRGRPDALPA